jgi:hypothetical protein
VPRLSAALHQISIVIGRDRGEARAAVETRGFALFVLLFLAACGTADDDGDVRIVRGSPDVDGWLDLTVAGTGFDVVEGMTVELQVGQPDRAPERLGWATTTVEDGAFSIHMSDVLEPGLYKRKILWIDGNGDTACDDYDLVYADHGLAVDDVTVELTRYREGAGFFFSSCDDVFIEWPAE